MLEERFLYFTGISLVALIIYLAIKWWLDRAEAKRAERIENLKRFDPIETRAPKEAGQTKIKERALDSLETRFSIVRRSALTLIFIAWTLLIVTPLVGKVPATLVSIIVTASAVVVGIAARPVVENFIAGFVITLSKQFRTGDTVLIEDNYGTIEDITPTHTIIKIWDWRRFILPNSAMLGKEIINYSTRDSFIWAKLEFYVSYDADLGEVSDLAVNFAKGHPCQVGSENPKFWVMALEKDAIKCWLAMWVASPADAWTIRVETGRALVEEMQRRGIKAHTFQHRATS